MTRCPRACIHTIRLANQIRHLTFGIRESLQCWRHVRGRERIRENRGGEFTARAGGRPPRTSPRPPVLLQGATSAAMKTRFIPLWLRPPLLARTATVARRCCTKADCCCRSGIATMQPVGGIGPVARSPENPCMVSSHRDEVVCVRADRVTHIEGDAIAISIATAIFETLNYTTTDGLLPSGQKLNLCCAEFLCNDEVGGGAHDIRHGQ